MARVMRSSAAGRSWWAGGRREEEGRSLDIAFAGQDLRDGLDLFSVRRDVGCGVYALVLLVGPGGAARGLVTAWVPGCVSMWRVRSATAWPVARTARVPSGAAWFVGVVSGRVGTGSTSARRSACRSVDGVGAGGVGQGFPA